MSYNTARIIFLIATILWIIALLIPYSRLGVAKEHITAIKIVMGAIFLGAFIIYAVSTP
jgi:hypothetical protein